MGITRLISSNQYVNVNLYIAKKLKHPLSALLLGTLCSQHDYWDELDKLDDDGFFFITRDLLYEKSSLTHEMQRTAEKYLIKECLIEFKTKGIPPKNHYKINLENLIDFLNLLPKKQPDNSEKLKSGDSRYSNMVDAEEQISGMPMEINTINTINIDKERMNETNKLDKIKTNMKQNVSSGVKDFKNASKKQKDSHEDMGVCLNKNTKYKKLKDIISDFTENVELREQLNRFITHFNYTFFKLSNASFEEKLTVLKDISKGDELLMIKIIKKTIESGWKTFYPLKEEQDNKNTNGRSYFTESDKRSYEEYNRKRDEAELATDEDGNLLKF